MLTLDRVEPGGDLRRPIRVAGEDDVVGQFARGQTDVVLAIPDR
jgi:hypothetical protein